MMKVGKKSSDEETRLYLYLFLSPFHENEI